MGRISNLMDISEADWTDGGSWQWVTHDSLVRDMIHVLRIRMALLDGRLRFIGGDDRKSGMLIEVPPGGREPTVVRLGPGIFNVDYADATRAWTPPMPDGWDDLL